MRTVLLVTRHADLAQLVPGLERTGFTASVVIPERLSPDEPGGNADVLVVDFRDVPNAAVTILSETLGEQGPVLLAVVADEQVERVALEGVVEDFLVVPFGAAEFARRVERALWRRHGIDSENFVRCGALTIDLSNYRVTVDEEPLVLTFKEYELLRFLAMNAGRVFTREQLLNRVWGYDYFGGARTVDVHIRRIRSKIEIHGHTFIETVRNVGYRLVAEARKQEVTE
jgi:DNA-binding response OmpR family regulator